MSVLKKKKTEHESQEIMDSSIWIFRKGETWRDYIWFARGVIIHNSICFTGNKAEPQITLNNKGNHDIDNLL